MACLLFRCGKNLLVSISVESSNFAEESVTVCACGCTLQGDFVVFGNSDEKNPLFLNSNPKHCANERKEKKSGGHCT